MLGKQIAHSGHCDKLRIYSKNIVTDLISHGVLPNKSLKDSFPVINDELFFDFLRGYIDGDGWYYIDNSNTYMHITCANKIPLQYIKEKLNNFEIKTQVYKENDKKYRLMCTSFNEMSKLVDRLYYEDGLFLFKKTI